MNNVETIKEFVKNIHPMQLPIVFNIPPKTTTAAKPWYKRLLFKILNLIKEKNSGVKIKQVKKIAFFRFGGIGDAISTTCILQTLAQLYPNATITFITSKEFSSLLRGLEFVDNIIIIPNICKIKQFSQFLLSAKLLLKHSKIEFDMTFFPHIDIFSYLSALFFHSKVKVGYDLYSSGIDFAFTHSTNIVPVNEQIIDFSPQPKMFYPLLECLDVGKYQRFYPKLKITSKENIWARKKLAKLNTTIIALLPGGTTQNKLYPKEKYLELIKNLQNKYNFSFLVLCGPHEVDLISYFNDILGVYTTNPHNSLRESLSLLSQTKLAIGNDTGFMHAAVALNLPTITLFGPTAATYYGYLSPKNVILQGKCNLMPCNFSICPITNKNISPCMKSINIDSIFHIAYSLIENH